MQEATGAKSALNSTTVWSGLGTMAMGIVLIVLSSFGLAGPDMAAVGVGQVALGASTIVGRVNATTPIKLPELIGRL